MNRERTVRALPRVLAAIALLVPFAAVLSSIEPPPATAILLSPLVLVAAVLVRAGVTRDPVDIILATVTAPCILAVAYAFYEHLALTPGVVWGPLFVALGTALLALAVLSDAAIERLTGTQTA
ncbi:hypothetical protein [Halorubrum sp. Atlit-28R]|uniref:hypothetical protein n=1 Tax=Halorubrum sp. Atlit-28R TaxID=2282129 RepID=UPI000EF1EC1B|nr:hypothetical protein [Halorubrum sp. Atlit-28R]RLM49645.1 hypothetical protein DVK06_13920 [Halorubrum sp. Atlit-28R]